MKIKEIRIIYKQHYFTSYQGLDNATNQAEIYKKKLNFLESNQNNIQLIKDEEVRNLDYHSKPEENGEYSGYYLEYYQGWMSMEGKNVSMTIDLTKTIIDLALKAGSGEIKELVKQEYQEFENQLYQLIDETEKKNQEFENQFENQLYRLIDETEKKNIFGRFIGSKFEKLKQAILSNSNNSNNEN